jgi:hypothetical protein
MLSERNLPVILTFCAVAIEKNNTRKKGIKKYDLQVSPLMSV